MTALVRRWDGGEMSRNAGASPPPDPAGTQAQGQALSGLQAIRAEDCGRFAAAAETAGVVSWSHFFPYLLFAGRPEAGHRLLYEFVGRSALVFRLETGKGQQRLSLLLAPFPFDPEALRRARDRMRAFNRTGEARIVRVQECEALLVAQEGFEIRHHSDEYVYDADAVARLEGARFATVRRKIGHYASGGASVRAYRPSDAPACRVLLDRWRQDMKAIGVSIGPYYRYTRTCLQESQSLPADRLCGQVVEVDGEVGAFSFGGGITTTHASVFITVADRRHPGLAYFQRKRLIDGLPGFRFFNDAHDSKRPGLAQMKRSFRPAAMHSVFSARRG